ncbi:MAG: hypothetical protein V1806_10890 [Pseudomonadota bacterium]
MDSKQPPKARPGMDIWQVWNDSLAEKMNQQGLDLTAQAEYLAQAVQQSRARDDRPALWAALNALSKISLALKLLPQARHMAGEALGLAEELWGADSPEAGTVISDLIFLEALHGHEERSLILSQRLRQIIQASLEAGLDRAFSYNLTSLATFYSLQGQDQATEDLLWGVARLAEEDPQADPDLLLFVYDNLGGFYQAKDDPDKARLARDCALKVMERAGYRADAGQVTRH